MTPPKTKSKAKPKKFARSGIRPKRTADKKKKVDSQRQGARRAFPVVGVGASAGGLDAVSRLLAALPAKPGVALVFVQHLSPTHESALPDLLSHVTTMPVAQAKDRTRIEVDHLYVVPPDAQMTVKKGLLRLVPRPTDRTQYTPIDLFMRSLADWGGDRVIGVLLSGTSSDGVTGLGEIRAAGGTAIAQDPETAEFDAMPRAAVSAGAADLILAPEQIAATIAGLQPARPVAKDPRVQAPPEPSFEDHQLRRIFVLLRNATGVDFSHYKRPTLLRRLQRRMILHKLTEIEAYTRRLEKDPTELQSLQQDFLIQVTRFFREPESFVALAKKVFPQFLKERPPGYPIRVWIPGCSTGEEAYSIAIALLEFLGDDGHKTPIQIFATDVNDKSIERARAGVYPASISEDVSPSRLRRFFDQVEGGYQVSTSVRNLCVFAPQDLTRDPPFSKLDLIVCRNVLIYLDPSLHKKLMSLFHYALRANGFLMLGRAESTGPKGDFFQVVDKKFRIFARKPSAGRLDLDFYPTGLIKTLPASKKPGPKGLRDPSGIQGEVNRVLLSRYAPPGVIVDSDLRIVQTRGQTSAFLELAPGEPSLSLFKMLRDGLLHGVRTVLNEARKSNQPVRKDGLKLKSNGHHQTLSVEVLPLGTSSSADKHFLVLFEQTAEGTESAKQGQGPDGNARKKRVRPVKEDDAILQMQQELAASREYLQSIIQDLEATNEELQSANEELQSTNEELDTATEELQSTNEEINTVNEELQARNEDLSRANSDLVNLLAGVQIAIVFLTNDLRIRRFTPVAERALNLIPTDIGRPIGNIRPNIECPDLEQMIQGVIDSAITKEREVRDREGKWFLLRVRPYKSVDNRIDGAVLVLLDIDEIRRHEQRVHEAREFAEAIVETIREPLVVLDEKLRIKSANQAFLRTFDVAESAPAGKRIYEVSDGAWNIAALRKALEEVLPADAHFDGFEVSHEFPRVGRKRMLLNGRRISGGDNRPPLILLAIEEVPLA